MKIRVEGDRLLIGGWMCRRRAIRFADIAEIAAEKVCKITYEEVFLIVRERSGAAAALGELDEGFADAERALRAHLPGFAANWYAIADQAPFGVRSQVWPPQS